MKAYLWGLRRHLRKGKRIYLFVTLRCNLKCPYCTFYFYNGKWPKCYEITFSQWTQIIDNLKSVREIVITGGEPMLYDKYNELCNYILDKGYFLMVFSNLMSPNGFDVKSHHRFMIYASLHVPANRKIWFENYKLYKRKYRINYEILNETKKVLTKEEEYDNCYLKYRTIYSPCGDCYPNILEMMRNMRYNAQKNNK